MLFVLPAISPPWVAGRAFLSGRRRDVLVALPFPVVGGQTSPRGGSSVLRQGTAQHSTLPNGRTLRDMIRPRVSLLPAGMPLDSGTSWLTFGSLVNGVWTRASLKRRATRLHLPLSVPPHSWGALEDTEGVSVGAS